MFLQETNYTQFTSKTSCFLSNCQKIAIILKYYFTCNFDKICHCDTLPKFFSTYILILRVEDDVLSGLFMYYFALDYILFMIDIGFGYILEKLLICCRLFKDKFYLMNTIFQFKTRLQSKWLFRGNSCSVIFQLSSVGAFLTRNVCNRVMFENLLIITQNLEFLNPASSLPKNRIVILSTYLNIAVQVKES